jgi:hypothetical protein
MKYEHIAWCKEGTADKVWGVIELTEATPTTLTRYGYRDGTNGKFVTFWGRRGAKLQTKTWQGSNWDAISMFQKKQNKGYRAIEIDELNTVYPEFQQDLEKTAFWATLQA